MIEAYLRLNFFLLPLKAFNETNMNSSAGQEVAWEVGLSIHAVKANGLENSTDVIDLCKGFLSTPAQS